MEMKANDYLVLQMCIENGLTRGYLRAHKHTEEPSEQLMLDVMEQSIMEDICEWFEFDEKN
jgi:hypothetical protein